MKPYIVIVHKDEHSAYGMSFPDAPGCFSGADDIDDLFAMATEALELWAEGMREDGNPIPTPRLLSELKAILDGRTISRTQLLSSRLIRRPVDRSSGLT